MNWDSKWTAVSAIAAVASFLLPVIFFFTGRDTKELTVETVSHSVLVDLSNPALSSLKPTYNDVSVDRLTVATIEIRNTGTRPIERADFESPIVLRFNNALDVLAATLSEKKPGDLTPIITSDMNGISIAPLLLNPGDLFRLTIQIRGIFSEPAVDARISGVPSIARQIYPGTNFSRRSYIELGLGLLALIAYLHVSAFVIAALVRQRPFTALPYLESTSVLLVLGPAGALLLLEGLSSFELPRDQFFSWTILGLFALAGMAIFPLARKRRIRIVEPSYR